jgi:hypothetical protein
MEVLKGKPASVMSIQSEASYQEIMSAIHFNQIPDKTLRAVVTTCRSNPDKVLFVVYKAFSDSVLLIFGSKPVCVELEGSKLQSIMSSHCRESRIYVFSYVK